MNLGSRGTTYPRGWYLAKSASERWFKPILIGTWRNRAQRRRPDVELSVDMAPMAYSNDQDQQHLVVDPIQDAVIPHPHSPDVTRT